MRARSFALAAAMTLAPPAARAEVPVDSVTADLQALKDYAQSLKTWVLQNTQALSEANTDIQTAKIYLQEVETYIAFVQNPSLGEAEVLMGQTGLGNDLPIDPMQLASLASGASMAGGGLTGALARLRMIGNLTSGSYAANHVYTCDAADPACADMNARGNGIAGSMGTVQAAYADVQAHKPVVQSLNDQLAGETTPALRETVMAHLQAEAAWSQNMVASAQQAQTQAALSQQAVQQRTLERQRQSADELFADTQPIAAAP